MHKDARLTSKNREVQIQRPQAGQRVAEVGPSLGISEGIRKFVCGS
jgi:hypothetical protein